MISSFVHSVMLARSGYVFLINRKPAFCYTVWMNSNHAMRFKPALTKEDLQAIQERGADSPDVRALLWEVARLRALALRTHDYFRQGSSSTSLILAESLRAMIEDEPAVQEQPKL